jgi:hypothetical protein
MLIALLEGKRVDAVGAARRLNYRCPNPKCNGLLVLKQGPKVAHHFAHKPPITCDWEIGETKEHREAKRLLLDCLKLRGLRAQAEFVVDTLPGDRRADVMVWHPVSGQMIAFELQHSSVSVEEIQRRAFSYARANIAQIWIPFLRSNYLSQATQEAGSLHIKRYCPRPFERWVGELHRETGTWMFEPQSKTMWLALMVPSKLYKSESTWYDEGGDERNSGGYLYDSKRYWDLSLFGPFNLQELLVKLSARPAVRNSSGRWPAGRIASFQRR